VGAGGVVTASVPDYALVLGVPARQVGWMSEYGERIELPLSGEGETVCKYTRAVYRLDGDKVRRID